MAFGSSFIGGLFGGMASSLEQRRAAKLQMELANKFFEAPVQVIERKIACDYCGRKGSTDQCVSCGAPMQYDPIIVMRDDPCRNVANDLDFDRGRFGFYQRGGTFNLF